MKGVLAETWELQELSRDTDGDTCRQWYCTAIGGSSDHEDTDVSIILSIISIKNEKLLDINNNRSKPVFFRLFWDIVVFRLVADLLNMICLKLRILYT